MVIGEVKDLNVRTSSISRNSVTRLSDTDASTIMLEQGRVGGDKSGTKTVQT